jgi:hypothetical protein
MQVAQRIQTSELFWGKLLFPDGMLYPSGWCIMIQNSKSQITNPKQIPIPNDPNHLFLEFEFGTLEFIWYLLFGIWCLSPNIKIFR